MVRLTRIYTRQGDAGQTHLGDMSRTSKASTRVNAFGDVDETNSAIGVALTHPLPADMAVKLTRIQNDLFDLGADLCVPDGGEGERLRIIAQQVTQLEEWCDEYNDTLPDLTSFVLPGGTAGAAALHVARTVCRRAERSVVALATDGEANPQALAYLNRLSDLLFILARAANAQAGVGAVMWVPGAERSTDTR
jgi:cob(I)alamin adenosyltransferase